MSQAIYSQNQIQNQMIKEVLSHLLIQNQTNPIQGKGLNMKIADNY